MGYGTINAGIAYEP